MRAMFIGLAALLPAYAAALELACPDVSSTGLSERQHISASAAGVVQRSGKRTLQVKAGGKTIRFADQPPYDEALAGQRYTYCDRKEGFILLKHEDEGVFGGKLINEATGEVLPGGERVIFSPDRRAYFTNVQPDGLDGEEWYLYAIDGRRSWKGFSFLPSPGKPGYFSAFLSDPAWDSRGQFSAQAICVQAEKITWRVTLIKTSGTWDWRPIRKCPEGR